MDQAMDQAFAVYWRAAAPRQLFAYRQSIKAGSPQEARNLLRGSHKRQQQPIILGVKRLAACGRRCAQRGQWVG